MIKFLVGVLVVLSIITSGLCFAQDDSANTEAKRIKELCTEYYNQGEDCPYDSVDGVPIMINGEKSPYQRFDNKDQKEEVKTEKPTFQSN